MQPREICDAADMSDAAGMDRRGANEVDQALLKERPAIVNAVEHLSYGKRRRAVLPDEPESLLVLGGDGVLQPEEVKGLK
jgi:hypothetical protein